jgi:hypothetical protein
MLSHVLQKLAVENLGGSNIGRMGTRKTTQITITVGVFLG